MMKHNPDTTLETALIRKFMDDANGEGEAFLLVQAFCKDASIKSLEQSHLSNDQTPVAWVEESSIINDKIIHISPRSHLTASELYKTLSKVSIPLLNAERNGGD